MACLMHCILPKFFQDWTHQFQTKIAILGAGMLDLITIRFVIIYAQNISACRSSDGNRGLGKSPSSKAVQDRGDTVEHCSEMMALMNP